MKLLFFSQIILVLAGTLLFWVFNTTQQTWSYAAGSGLVLLNFALLASGWGLLFQKKWVALAVIIIVIKYAILGALLFYLVNRPWMNLVGFSVGVASFVATALIFAFSKRHHGV